MEGRAFELDTQMVIHIVVQIVNIVILLAFIALLALLVRALLKYLKSADVRKEQEVIRQSLGEALKAHRVRCKMTQEFVAETLGVTGRRCLSGRMGALIPVRVI